MHSKIKQISVVGAGIMGHGIAQSFLMGGYPVCLFDIGEELLATAKAHIENSLELFFKAGLIDRKGIGSALGLLTLTSNLNDAVKGSDFIVEAAPEDLPLKQDLFARIEGLCRGESIIASNTSSLTLTGIGAKVRDKGRLVTTHWFNPPQLVPTVEVVKGESTTDETVNVACELLTDIRKVPVRINRELPGFLVNRIQMAMAREILDLYEKGVASAEDIDRAIKGSIGFRLASIGPLMTMDLGGLRLWLRVLGNLLPEIQSAVEAPKALTRLVSEGHDGVKSGRGFYDYSARFKEGELEEAVHRRDQEFLKRLRDLYWEGEPVK